MKSLDSLSDVQMSRLVGCVLGGEYSAKVVQPGKEGSRSGGLAIVRKGFTPVVGETWTEALLCAREEFDLGHPEATGAEWLSWFNPTNLGFADGYADFGSGAQSAFLSFGPTVRSGELYEHTAKGWRPVEQAREAYARGYIDGFMRGESDSHD